MKDMIKVGTITSTHGIRGEVKIIGDNDCFSPSFKEALFIETNPMTEVHIKTVKNQNGKLIISFKEFDNINQVERFKNLGIFAKRDTLGELEEDEVYLTDLIDMEVYNEEEKFIGVVVDIREYPQCYYLVVEDDEDKKYLIPFIKEFVVDITDVIVIHEMEGLLR
jgi:16S rRNA processing protein RimM